MLENLKGRLTICKTTGSEGNYVSIRVEDDDACARALEIRLSLEEFANCVFGLACCKCEFDLNTNTNVMGKKRQHKTVQVFVPANTPTNRDGFRAAALRQLVSEYEDNGWEGHDEDCNNHHNCTRQEPPKGKKGNWYNVHFVRWVEKDGRTDAATSE